jgi:hypothetical protein
VNAVVATVKLFDAGEANVRLWPEVMVDVHTPSIPLFSGRLRAKLKLLYECLG